MFTSAMSSDHRKKVLHIGKSDITRINASYSKFLEKEKYDQRVIKDYKMATATNLKLSPLLQWTAIG